MGGRQRSTLLDEIFKKGQKQEGSSQGKSPEKEKK